MIQGIRPVPTLLLLATAATGAAASDRDARIESAARQSYSFKVHLKDEAIQVKSSGGHVTLTGTVSERWRRDLAEETVAGLPGVKGVDNQLVVASQAPPEASDAWLASRSARLCSSSATSTHRPSMLNAGTGPSPSRARRAAPPRWNWPARWRGMWRA
jgi:hypothetical protein